MSRIDSQFVTKILKFPEYDWLSSGITSEMLSLDTKSLFSFIKKESLKYHGKIPDIYTIKQFFPSFRLKKCPESLDFYADKIYKRYTAHKLRELTADMAETLNEDEPDLEHALTELTSVSAKLSFSRAQLKNTYHGKDASERLQALKKIQKGNTSDYSLGHEVLDEDLIGAEKGNFFMIAGSPKAGKTWLLLKTLYNLWLDGLDILLFSYELSKKLIQRRLDAIVAEISYGKFRRGIVSSRERKEFTFRLLDNQKRKNYFLILSNEDCDPTSKVGPSKLDYVYAKIMQHKPQIVGIDGMYLMSGEGDSDWTRLAYLSRNFHNVTQATGVCGWATSQLGRATDEKNPKIKDLAYNYSFSQDTDGLFLMTRPEDMKMGGEALLAVGGFREAEDVNKYVVEFDPGATIKVERMAPQVENPLMD